MNSFKQQFGCLGYSLFLFFWGGGYTYAVVFYIIGDYNKPLVKTCHGTIGWWVFDMFCSTFTPCKEGR